MAGNWERRWQPLLDQWVLISATTAKRPWSGAMAGGHDASVEEHDANCFLCPRVSRANGVRNADYKGSYAFDNDFASLSFDAPQQPSDTNESVLELTAPIHGRCRVLCWSERHNATLASLGEKEMNQVALLWQEEYRSLSQQEGIANVLIFENKGTEIGVSNLHPHGQIYASSFVTDTASRMRNAQTRYAERNQGASLLQTMLESAYTRNHLLVEEGHYFSLIVPFAARFAYETWIVPKRHVGSLADMDEAEINELGSLYQTQARRYDILFKRSSPNITLLHNAPCDHDSNESGNNQHWCFHLAFQPPLRDPEKLKFLAGFESGSNNIVNPVQPEAAAQQLRNIDVSEWRA